VLAIDGEEFRVGDQVIHTAYGKGMIRQLEGEGEAAAVTVDFVDEGVKTLLLAYAPLVKA
jgi:DNA helicase-2/ATP-dependent DNA helicase PcrA